MGDLSATPSASVEMTIGRLVWVPMFRGMVRIWGCDPAGSDSFFLENEIMFLYCMEKDGNRGKIHLILENMTKI